MSREVRRVPKDWTHPKRYDGSYQPLIEGYLEAIEYYSDDDEYTPDIEDYMPEWSEEEKTHYQMYETVSEGTPLSPPMETPEKLARWLTDNNAYAGGTGRTATYEQWLKMIGVGWSPTGVVTNGTLMSGVVACSELTKD